MMSALSSKVCFIIKMAYVLFLDEAEFILSFVNKLEIKMLKQFEDTNVEDENRFARRQTRPLPEAEIHRTRII